MFKLFDERYPRTATLITTNLEYDQWYGLFQNKPLVDALLDRLRHHCIPVRLSGPLPANTDPGITQWPLRTLG